MSSLYFLAFAGLGILFAAYIRYKSDSNRLSSLQRRHEIYSPDIDFEYDRFNTKNERKTSVRIEGGQLSIITDIQNIRIANQTLVSKISSEYDELPIQFDIVIQPFEKELFDVEGFTNFSQDGILILWSYGAYTKFPIEQIEKLNFLVDVIPSEPQGVYLNLESFTVDQVEDSVILKGKFEDGKDFKIHLNYKAFLLEFLAPIESIKNFKNFKDLEELNIDKTED